MGVFLDPPDPILAGFLHRLPGDCFLCGDSVRGQLVVYWSGNDGHEVFLHPKCAQELGCHLISDALLAKGKAFKGPIPRPPEDAA